MVKNTRCRKVKLAIAALLVAGALYPMTALAATNNKLIVRDSGGTIDKFVVTDTGYVGIGNNAPLTAISILGNSTASTQLKLFDNLNAAGTNGGGGFLFGHNNGAALPLQNDRLGYLNAGAVDDLDGVTLRFGGGLQLNAAANWSIDRTTAPPALIYHFPSYLRFQTAGANAGNVTGGNGGSLIRMLIYPEGNVYLGTVTTPLTPPAVTQKLEVDGGVRLVTATTKPTCDATVRGTLWFTNNGSAKDALEVCAYTGSAFGWQPLY